MQADARAAAARRLDDTFRGYLAERGAKPVPLAEMTTLVTGVAGLRLAADAVLDLWQRDDGSPAGDRAAARHELLRSQRARRAAGTTISRPSLAGARAVPRSRSCTTSARTPAARRRAPGSARRGRPGDARPPYA